MGDARRKLLTAGQARKFDFAAPKLHIMAGDRANLARDEHGIVSDKKVVPRAVRLTLTTITQAAFPGGMDRRDGKLWAAWLDAMDDDGPTTAEVTQGMIEWLRKHVNNDELRIQAGMAQWREAIADYLESDPSTPTS